MRPGQASRTAEYAALFRAIESARRPASARLFEDPLAVRFLGPGLRRIARWSGLPVLGRLVWWLGDRLVRPGAMTAGIARTRLIDDLVREAVAGGVHQIVILGAGYDTRAQRLHELAGCRVVEVDHPDTLARKRALLAALPAPPLGRSTHLGRDLRVCDLGQVWREAGLGRDERSLVLWEGVTHYLGAQAVDATLRALAGLAAPGSRLVFSYLHGGLLDGSEAFELARSPMAAVAAAGEPWIWGVHPEALVAYLGERGFRLLQDVGADEVRARYWGDRGRRMRGFSFYRIALAEVG